MRSAQPSLLTNVARHMCRYENLPDPDTDTSLPVVTITDFATGEAGKEVRASPTCLTSCLRPAAVFLLCMISRKLAKCGEHAAVAR